MVALREKAPTGESSNVSEQVTTGISYRADLEDIRSPQRVADTDRRSEYAPTGM